MSDTPTTQNRSAVNTAHGAQAWLRGGVGMAADAFIGGVNIVQGVQRAVTRTVVRMNPTAAPVGWSSDFVYGRVRDISRLSFWGVQQLAGLADTMLPTGARDVPARLSLNLQSAVNGAFGDYLERRGNALALPWRLLDGEGREVTPSASGLHAAFGAQLSPRLAVLVHGLGMNDQQWSQQGKPDYGERLARDFGYTSLRVRYNSGRHISYNGRELAHLLESLYTAYPETIERLTIIGHSMGGLIAHSASHYAREAGYRWVDACDDMVFLGSPHLGAPLERLGNEVTRTLRRLSYTAPFAAIGDIRSAGVKDLSHGYMRDEDWQANPTRDDAFKPADAPAALDHVGYYLIAATLGRRDDDPVGRWFGDLLVPVASAVGHSRSPDRRFDARTQQGRVFYGMNHFKLIHHDAVYDAIAGWLAPRLDEARIKPTADG